MAPVASRLSYQTGLVSLPRRALSQYLRLLQLYPVLTKAATSSAFHKHAQRGSCVPSILSVCLKRWLRPLPPWSWHSSEEQDKKQRVQRLQRSGGSSQQMEWKLNSEQREGREVCRNQIKVFIVHTETFDILVENCSEGSGILSALGNVLAQMIKKRKKENRSQKLDSNGPLIYAIYGFFFTGPLSHFFYLFMEHWIPPEAPWAGVRRLLLDRLVIAPAFLLLFFLTMNFLEGGDPAAGAAKVRSAFWPALQTNWRIWTPVQFININYVPLQFRVLFANLVALFWYAYLASLGK